MNHPRTVAIPELAWQAISGSEVLGGGGPVATTPLSRDAELRRRVERSGYCLGLVYGLATARVIRRGKSRSYEAYLTDEACADLLELFEALLIGAEQDGTASERRSIRLAMQRLA